MHFNIYKGSAEMSMRKTYNPRPVHAVYQLLNLVSFHFVLFVFGQDFGCTICVLNGMCPPQKMKIDQ